MSLNSGFELDDDVVGFEEDAVQLLEPFSADDQAQMLVTLEARLIDLQDLAEEIEATQGMSQDFAMEALRILPDVLSAKPSHFSKSPSATRLKVSLEEITTGVWALIAAAAAAIIGIIYKLYKWIAGDKSSDGEANAAGISAAADKGEKEMEKQKEVAEATSEALVEAADSVKDAAAELHGKGIEISDKAIQGQRSAEGDKKVRYTDFDHLIEKLLTDTNKYELAKKFLESNDPLFHDIIKVGEYTKMAEDAGVALLTLKDAIETKLKLLEGILKNDLNSHRAVDEWKNNETLESPKLKEVIQLKFKGSMVPIDQVAKQLRDVKEKTMAKKVSERINFDKLFERMASVYKKPTNMEIFESLRLSIITTAKLEERIEKMNDLSNNLAHDGQPGSASSGVAVRIRQVVLTLGKDVYGYAALANELKYYAMHSQYLAREALGFGLEVVRKIDHAMKMDGEEVPEVWKKVLKDLDKHLAHLRDVQRVGGNR